MEYREDEWLQLSWASVRTVGSDCPSVPRGDGSCAVSAGKITETYCFDVNSIGKQTMIVPPAVSPAI